MNYKGKISDWLSPILGLAFYVVIFIPYFFGIGFSFYRFGSTDGIISIVAPPFAWYRGISYFWVEPKWKEDWDIKTGTLAFLILNTGSDDPRVELEFLQYEGSMKKWINKIPDEKRKSLQNESEALGMAFMAYQEEFMNYLINPADANQIWDSPSIQQHVSVFRNETGFMENWNKMKTDHRYTMEILKQKQSDFSPEELQNRMTDFIATERSALLAMLEEKISTRINNLFGK